MVTLNKLPDIQLAKDGYDPFIDFMKGFCILSVVLVHAIPHIPGGVYTIGQCVPLFLLIQVYHYYKNGMENAKPFNIQKVWKRILRPFFGVQLFIISVYAITHYHSETFQEMAVKVLSKGGYGAGSYYPWIYIQFAILLSLLAKWLSKLSNVKIGGVILTFCIVAELVCNLLHVSEEFWRLACFRYLFLIYLGILWCKNGLRIIVRGCAWHCSVLFPWPYFHIQALIGIRSSLRMHGSRIAG